MRKRVNNLANYQADACRDRYLKERKLIPENGSLDHKHRKSNNPDDAEFKARRTQEVMRTLELLDLNKPEDLYEPVGQTIWGRNSIFYYEKEVAVARLIEDNENSNAERPPEFLKQMWDKKWDSMDFSWFQMHKHLGPSEKKKDATPKYYESVVNHLINQRNQASGQLPPTAGHPYYPQQP